MVYNLTLKALSIVLLIACITCSKTYANEESKLNLDRPIEDKWALVIGIDKFQDPRIPTLKYSAKDAKDFAEFLATKGNFARDHIKLLLNENATHQAIEESLGDTWLPRRALSDDLVVIYVSTHGSPKEIDVGKDNWLIAHNTKIGKLFSTGIQLKTLANTVKNRTGCDRVVLILDACNSGAAEAGGGKGIFRSNTANFDVNSIVGEGEIVISSSESNQRSWESKRYTNGVFTKKLIELLSATGNSMPINKVFEELKSVVEQEVRFDRKVTQTPVFKSKWKGNPLILTAKPTKPRKIKHLESSPTVSSTPNNQPENKIKSSEPSQKIASASINEGSLAGKVEHRRKMTKSKLLSFFSVIPPKTYIIKKSPAYGTVTQQDFNAISSFPPALANAIDAKLSAKLGSKYLSRLALAEILQKNKKSGKRTFVQLCNQSNAKYVTQIAISKFYFKGQVSWSNIYDIKCVIHIFDGGTGAEIKKIEKRYKKQPWLGDGTGWIDYVNNKIIPKFSNDISDSILKSL